MSEDIEGLRRAWFQCQECISSLDKVFVVGCAKSGTSWLADLLNAHEAIVVQGEGAFAYKLVPLLGQAFKAFNDHQKDAATLAQLRNVDITLIARAIVDGQLYRYIAESGRDFGRIRVVGDKTPQHSVGIDTLNTLYPAAKFIHIIRDPRDTATSAWFHTGQNENRSFEQYIEHYMTQVWPINVTLARQSGRRLGGRYTEVRYEDLLADTSGHLWRLLEFLNVDAGDSAVAGCIEAASFQKKSGGRAPGQKDNKSFYRCGTSGDWVNHIPVELAAKCCAKIAPLMKRCGYDATCERSKGRRPPAEAVRA
jgi:hypothetical protein